MIPAGIISADGHVCEPANCYVDYIDPKYRDDAPRIVRQDDGTDAFVIPGMRKPVKLGFIDGAGFGPKERAERARHLTFEGVREAAEQTDPEQGAAHSAEHRRRHDRVRLAIYRSRRLPGGETGLRVDRSRRPRFGQFHRRRHLPGWMEADRVNQLAVHRTSPA
jgi:hypothetical protein